MSRDRRNGARRSAQRYSPLEEHPETEENGHEVAILETQKNSQKPSFGKESWRDYWVDFSMFLFFLQVTRKDFGKKKLQFGLGLISCTFVVMIVSLLLSMITNSPIIFQRLSELEDGEIDLRLSTAPEGGTLNFTLLSDRFAAQNLSDFSYTAPRFEFEEVSFYSYKRCRSGFDPWSIQRPRWQYESTSSDQQCDETAVGQCFDAVCGTPLATSTRLFGVDQQRELRMELGRGWPVPTLEAGEVALQAHLARVLHAQVGDTVIARLNASVLLKIVQPEEEFLDIEEVVFVPLRVSHIFSGAMGKHGSGLDKTAVIEYSTIPQIFASQLHPIVQNLTRSRIESLDPYQYAPVILGNLPPSRTQAYLSFDEQGVTDSVSAWASAFVYRAAFPQLTVKLPVLAQLQLYNLFGLFLALILDVIIFILMFLSVLLIYSLLMVAVETKTFETGVMRMLGMSRIRVVQLLLLQAMCFALPALFLGLLGAQGLQMIVASYMSSLTGVQINPALSLRGILLAASLGLFMPVVASILPIFSALQQNLAEALDSNRSKAKAVEYHVARSETSEADWTVMLVGSGVAVFGFAINYLFPMALVTFNLSLLGNIFLGLLMGMLLGLVLLAVNVQNLLEKGLVYVALAWEQPAIQSLVLKNLSAHRRRNRKTSVMYALSLGFIIFLSIYAAVNLSSFEMREQRRHGAYLTVEATGSLDEETQRDIGAVRATYDSRGRLKVATRGQSESGYHWIHNTAAFEELLLGTPHVAAFSWKAAPLRDVSSKLVYTELMNLGKSFFSDVEVIAMAPDYPSAALSQYFEVKEQLHRGMSVRGMFDELYSVSGSKYAFVSTFENRRIGATVQTDTLLHFTYSAESNQSDDYIRMRPLAVFDAFPGILMTRIQSQLDQALPVSLTTWLRLSGGDFQSIDEIPMKSLLIKMRGSYGQYTRETDDLKTALRLLIGEEQGVYLYDYDVVNDRIETSNLALTFIFQFTTASAMLICFFSLISSMYTSVHEQRKEIGILLSLGLPRSWLTRAFIEEAFTVVLTSSLLGLLIGLMISWTIALQRQVMIALPFSFPMPWAQIALMVTLSIVFAFLSSFGSIRQITQSASIVSIMKSA